MRQAISFSASITLPGKIISQNATSVSGNTLKWEYSLSPVNPDNAMTATCEITNITNIYIANGIGVLLLIIAIVGILKLKKSRPNRFIMDVELDDIINKCHCPSTGRIGNFIFKDIPCLMSKAKDEKRTVE